MAQKVTVVLEDDLTGGPAEQTVRFAFDGTDYEIDLSAKNAAAFGKQLAPTLSTPAGRAGHHPAGLGGPRPTASAPVISGPGLRSTAWRSVSAAAFRPVW
jgi:Lsr2